MNAAEHYREAERLAEEARFAMDEPASTVWTFGTAIQAAQVHATLALAGAFAAGLQAPGDCGTCGSTGDYHDGACNCDCHLPGGAR